MGPPTPSLDQTLGFACSAKQTLSPHVQATTARNTLQACFKGTGRVEAAAEQQPSCFVVGVAVVVGSDGMILGAGGLSQTSRGSREQEPALPWSEQGVQAVTASTALTQ